MCIRFFESDYRNVYLQPCLLWTIFGGGFFRQRVSWSDLFEEDFSMRFFSEIFQTSLEIENFDNAFQSKCFQQPFQKRLLNQFGHGHVQHYLLGFFFDASDLFNLFWLGKLLKWSTFDFVLVENQESTLKKLHNLGHTTIAIE